MALQIQAQRDFSAGQFQNPAPELIPPTGFLEGVNALLEEDGTVIKRGGCTYKSNADAGTVLDFLWDGYLAAGRRTVAASTLTQFLFTLNADDATLSAPFSSGSTFVRVSRPTVCNGVLFLPAAADYTIYGGARQGDYLPGTSVTVTQGSTTVTGVGTAFLANVTAGHIVRNVDRVYGVVESVQSNTSLTLTAPANGTLTATTIAFTQAYTQQADSNVIASVSGRLVKADETKVAFSAAGDPWTFDPTDYHQIPAGGQVLGMESLRSVLFVFTTAGVFTISGMDYDLTDARGNVQHRLEQINSDIVLLDPRGIAGWRGALIVPAQDDIYLFTQGAAPVPLSEPISRQYREYVAAGYQCGHATVHRSHYFLPILNGSTCVTVLVCKLPSRAWTQWSGQAGTVTAFARRDATSGSGSSLFAVGGQRILNVGTCFDPAAARKNDADGTTPTFSLTTRQYTLNGLAKGFVKKVRVRYTLNDAATDNPTISAYLGTGEDDLAVLSGTAPEDNGANPHLWAGNVRDEYATVKLSSSSPCALLKIHSIELLTRPSGRQ